MNITVTGVGVAILTALFLAICFAIRLVYKTYWRRQFRKIYRAEPKDAALGDVFGLLLRLRESWEITYDDWKTMPYMHRLSTLETGDRIFADYRRARRAAMVFGLL